MRHDFCDGKYTVIHEPGKLTALRNGEPWQDLVGNNLVYWMLVEVDRLKNELGKLSEPDEAQCETEAQGYAMEALWQFLPDLPIREDGRTLLTPAQFEVVLRRCGWTAPSDRRSAP
jgi:hypothetical protein